jgi:hypothetical protein
MKAPHVVTENAKPFPKIGSNCCQVASKAVVESAYNRRATYEGRTREASSRENGTEGRIVNISANTATINRRDCGKERELRMKMALRGTYSIRVAQGVKDER